MSCFRDLHPRQMRLPIALALLITSASAVLSAQAFHNAQGVRAQDNGSDVKFHKFQPAIQPEEAVTTGTTQGQFDTVTTRQIMVLEQEKASRTVTQQKIDSNVLYTVRMLAGKEAAPGVRSLNTGVDLDDGNNLLVDITANVTNSLLQRLNDSGARIWYSNARFRSIRAVVPSAQIESIAALPDVIFIAPKVESMTASAHGFQRGPLQLPRPNFALRAERIRKQLAAAMLANAGTGISGTGQGSVTTQGDATHRAVDARGTFGVNGAGLKIGVLSDSANATGALNAAQASGDMPPTCPAGPPCFTMLQDNSNGADEGVAMMEIIYDMAPGASLFFATADQSEASFAQNILTLRAAGCDIIVDDVFYTDEPVFQDGIIAQAVSAVTADGALYFSTAGNEGNVDSNTAGYFEGDFNDSGSSAFTGSSKPGTIHNFGTAANPVNGDIITAAGSTYTLNWADPQGASSNDYDLFLVSSTGVVKASSTNLQIGGQDPFEQITPLALEAGDRLVVFKTATAANRFFAINTIRGTLAVNTAGQIHGHASAAGVGAYSVAATPAATAFAAGFPAGPFPNPFNATDSIEPFTSDGPRRVFFNADGSAITPGDFSSTGGAVRNKPDITAADGVSNTLPRTSGLNPFYGTSAAAPAAASVAALVRSANPALTQSDIRTALTSTAIDIMAPGNDRDSGAGIIMAFEAVDSLGVTGTANPILATITAAENPGNGNGVIEAGEGGRLSIQLKNVGLLTATGITATLTTSTPGVTVTLPGASTYPDLAANNGSAANATPFTFTVASDAACALVINFKLAVNYAGGPQRTLTFSVPTGMVTFTNSLGTRPVGALGVTTASGHQTNRVTHSNAASACSVHNDYPGTTTTTARTYDSYGFTACTSACVAPVLTSPNGTNLFEVAYAGAFDANNISDNYAADSGASSSPQSFGLSTTAGKSYTVVVSDVPGTAAGSNYSFQLPACALNCNINHVPVAIAQNVTVVSAAVGGSANASINSGSSDADGDPLTITQTPPGPYPQGNTSVMLTVTDTKGAVSQATAVVTVVNPGTDSFTFIPTLPSVTVTAGLSALEHFTFTPNPSTATATAFACSGLPVLASCSFAPASAPAGNTPVDLALTITTTGATAALKQPRSFYAMWLPFSGLGAMGLVLIGTGKKNKNRMRLATFAVMALVLMFLLSGCGGSSSHQQSTPTGSFAITVTATSATGVTHSSTFTLVVQ